MSCLSRLTINCSIFLLQVRLFGHAGIVPRVALARIAQHKLPVRIGHVGLQRARDAGRLKDDEHSAKDHATHGKARRVAQEGNVFRRRQGHDDQENGEKDEKIAIGDQGLVARVNAQKHFHDRRQLVFANEQERAHGAKCMNRNATDGDQFATGTTGAFGNFFV